MMIIHVLIYMVAIEFSFNKSALLALLQILHSWSSTQVHDQSKQTNLKISSLRIAEQAMHIDDNELYNV